MYGESQSLLDDERERDRGGSTRHTYLEFAFGVDCDRTPPARLALLAESPDGALAVMALRRDREGRTFEVMWLEGALVVSQRVDHGLDDDRACFDLVGHRDNLRHVPQHRLCDLVGISERGVARVGADERLELAELALLDVEHRRDLGHADVGLGKF